MKHFLILILMSFIAFSSNGKGLNTDVQDFNVTSTEGHELLILNDGYNALNERLESIKRAKKTIDLETFIWNQDISGKLMVLALINKAKEGVKVRVLIDTFVGAKGLNFFIAHEMRSHGIEVKYYNPSPTVRIIETQWRNHKKSMTVDGIESIVGGRNIGDEYFDLSETYNFVDRDVFVKGPIVKHITYSFNSIWKSKESVKVLRSKKPKKNSFAYRRGNTSRSRVKFKRDLKSWNENVQNAKEFTDITSVDKGVAEQIINLSKLHAPMQSHGTCSNVTFVSDRPISNSSGKTGRVLKKEIDKRLLNVKEKVLIESPYFILNQNTKNILDEITNKKVDITLLTNYLYSTDAVYVSAAFNNIIKYWLNNGMEIFLYKGDTQKNYQTINEGVQNSRWGTHAKSIVFDESSIMIGSYNFDPRSYKFSAELALFCNDDKFFAKELLDDMNQRKEDSFYMDSEETIDETKFKRIGTVKRIAYYILKIPSTLFSFLL